MIIHLDTSILVAALSGRRDAQSELAKVIDQGHRVGVSTMVLYEWLRGPRNAAELEIQEALLPRDGAVAFGSTEADTAARLYRRVKRARGREIDLAVAACAVAHNATLWTLNVDDFEDIPELKLL